jgi:hypothetical protein
MQDLEAAVAESDTVTASAVTLLQTIPGLIESVAGDKAASVALAADLRTNAAALAAAVTANTPVPAGG